jgi:hypothetical protein
VNNNILESTGVKQTPLEDQQAMHGVFQDRILKAKFGEKFLELESSILKKGCNFCLVLFEREE